MRLRQYAPLRPERREARRFEGRVRHNRIKSRPSDVTPEQERFHESLRRFENGQNRPCQCGCGRPGEALHHLMARVPGKRFRRDNWFVVLLSHRCHTFGRDSIHMLGSEAAFERMHGVNLAEIAVGNLQAWQAKVREDRT